MQATVLKSVPDTHRIVMNCVHTKQHVVCTKVHIDIRRQCMVDMYTANRESQSCDLAFYPQANRFDIGQPLNIDWSSCFATDRSYILTTSSVGVECVPIQKQAMIAFLQPMI